MTNKQKIKKQERYGQLVLPANHKKQIENKKSYANPIAFLLYL